MLRLHCDASSVHILPGLLALIVALCLASPLAAQDPKADSNAGTSANNDGASSPKDTAEPDDDEENSSKDPDKTRPNLSATQRLERARRAFRSGQPELIRPLLEPTLIPKPMYKTSEARIQARILLAYAYFFETVGANEQTQRKLEKRTRRQMLALLREEPDYKLNPADYPYDFGELLEDVRQQNKKELDTIRAKKGRDNNTGGSDVLYFERQVQRRNLALVFFPLGIGQIQNGHNLKGALFGTTQFLALFTNVWAFATIENLRQPDGFFEREVDYPRALQLRNLQFTAAAVFGLLYIASVLDAYYFFSEEDIRVRTLDRPPPELAPSQNKPTTSGAEEAILEQLGSSPRPAPILWSWGFHF